MPTLSLVVETVLDGSLRLKATGTGFNRSTAKMLVVYDDVAVTSTGAPFASLVVDIDNISTGAFEKLFNITGLTNGDTYVIKAIIGDIEAVVVDGPSARPTKPVVSIIGKKEDAVKIQVNLVDKFGGDYDDVLLFVKLCSGNTTSSIQKISLGPFSFAGKTTAQMKIERVLDSTVFEKEKLYEVAAISSSARTGFSLISEPISVKMSDLLDAVKNIIVGVDSVNADRVNTSFDTGDDFFVKYVTKVYADLANPLRITSMILKSPVTFLVNLSVNGIFLEQSVSHIPLFTVGGLIGGTLVNGVLTGQTWQDANLVKPVVQFSIPDSLRNVATLSVVAKVTSICERAEDNLYDYNEVSSAATDILGKIGVSAGFIPSAKFSFAKGTQNEDIVATIRVYFNTDDELHNYHGKNRQSPYSNLYTFMDIIDSDSKAVIEANIQLGEIGTDFTGAFSVSRTYTNLQYKDSNGLGRKLGLRFKSSLTSTGQKTLPVVSPVATFIEFVGEMATFAVESAGTVASPQIQALWTLGKTFGSKLKDFEILYLKEMVKVTGLTTGAWVQGTAYSAGDSATYESNEYVCLQANSYTLYPAYSAIIIYQSGEQASLNNQNFVRQSDTGGNTLSGVLPTNTTAWSVVNPIQISNVLYWQLRFNPVVYSNKYAPTVREQFFTNEPDGTGFVRATIVNLRIRARFEDRNDTDPLAVQVSNSLDEKASMGSHIVNALQKVVSYDVNANTGTITIKDKITTIVSIAMFSPDDEEFLLTTTNARLQTKVSDNATMTLNTETLTASSGTADAAIKTYNLIAGVSKTVYIQQLFTIIKNNQTFTYNGPVTIATLILRKNIELTNPTVTYSGLTVAPPAYNSTTVYPAGAIISYQGSTYTRRNNVNTVSNIVPIGGTQSAANWNDNGPFSTARVTFSNKADAVTALDNSTHSDIRTVFGVTIVENGATLNGWSTIGIPHIATATAMAASYKSGSTSSSFNNVDSSYDLVTGKWNVNYGGVWSAAIQMASSSEGARMIANPSSSILSSSI